MKLAVTLVPTVGNSTTNIAYRFTAPVEGTVKDAVGMLESAWYENGEPVIVSVLLHDCVVVVRTVFT